MLMSNVVDRRNVQAYPFHFSINTRFTETDANGHINNVSYLLYYEDAQAAFLLECFPEMSASKQWRFQQVRCDVSYDGQSYYPDPMTVATGVEHIDDCWVRLSQALFQRGQFVGLCDVILVKVDAQGRPQEINAGDRTALELRRLRAY